jgi:DnaK suppressor protein
MNDQFVKQMKEELLAEKTRLEEELSKFTHRNQKAAESDFETDFPDHGDGEDENAAEVAEFSNNLSLEDELEKALRDVEKTLERITDDTYGICKYCNAEIDERRLKARPTSSSCIQCKKTLTQEV